MDGGFDELASWEQCSKSCETGISIRQLACTKPTPKHGGKPCLGNATQFEECNTQPCPGKSQFLVFFRKIRMFYFQLMENGHHGDHGVNVQTAVELLIKQGYETVLIQSLRTVALSVKAKMKIPSNAEIPQKNVASSLVAQNMNSDLILALCILKVELQRPKLRQCSNVANISNGKMTKQCAYIMVRLCKLNIKTQSDLFHTFQNHYTKFKLWKV